MLRTLTLLFVLFIALSVQSQSWKELTPVPADGRDDAVAFSLAGKGFLVTGNQGGFSESNRLWMYDPASDSWTEKAPFPGTPRQYAGVFSVGDAGYVVAGISGSSVPLNDTWRYDYLSDSWTRVADFPGEARWSVFNFELFGKGYVGTGTSGSNLLDDAWSYDPVSDAWERIADFPGYPRRETASFSCLGFGYVGLGYLNINGSDLRSDFYSYNPLNNQWNRIADFPDDGRSYAMAIGVGSLGIVGSGMPSGGNFSDVFYGYDPLSGEWKDLPAFPVTIRGMSAFSIEQIPYFVTGLTGNIERTSRAWRLELTEEQSPTIAIYPNPGTGLHVIRAESGTQYVIYTSDSRKVKSGTIGPENVQLVEDLRPGLYSIAFSDSDNELISSQLLIVE